MEFGAELNVQVCPEFLWGATKLLLDMHTLYFSFIASSKLQEKVSIP